MMLGLGALLGGLVVAAAGSPSAVTAPTARTPSQVEVVNFPDPQQVFGTVQVSNLPPVQGVEVVNEPVDVSGHVTVTNLPLDGDGNLRVVGAGADHRSFAIPGLFVPGDGSYARTQVIDAAGWQHATIVVRIRDAVPHPTQGVDFVGKAEFGVTDDLGSEIFPGLGDCQRDLDLFPYGQLDSTIHRTEVCAPQLRIAIRSALGNGGPNPGDAGTGMADIWVYLAR